MLDQQVEIVPGRHVVVRVAGAIVLVARPEAGAVTADSTEMRVAEALAQLVSEAAEHDPAGPGRSVARAATQWLMRDAEQLTGGQPIQLGILSRADGDGLAIFLHGAVTALLAGERGTEYLRGVDAAFTVDRVVAAPQQAAVLFADDSPGRLPDLPVRGIGSLVEGVAPAAAAIVWFERERSRARDRARPETGVQPEIAVQPDLVARPETGARHQVVQLAPIILPTATNRPSLTGQLPPVDQYPLPVQRAPADQPPGQRQPLDQLPPADHRSVADPLPPTGQRSQADQLPPADQWSQAEQASADQWQRADQPGADQWPPADQLPPTGQRPLVDQLPPTGQRPLVDQLPPTGQRPLVDQLPPTGQRPPQDQLPPTGQRPLVDSGHRPDRQPSFDQLPPTDQLPPVDQPEGAAYAGGPAFDPFLEQTELSAPRPVASRAGTNPSPPPDPDLERRIEETTKATKLTANVLGFTCARAHPTDPRAAFCTVCGMPVDQTQQLIEVLRPPLGVLVLDDGTVFPVVADAVLGRDPENSEPARQGLLPWRIEDASGGMSRAHAEIRLTNWDVMIVDRGSTNGTRARLPGYRDWIRLQPNQPLTLVFGAEVMLGNRMLRLEPAAPPPFG
ncbi:FHA domain-containing protein [Nocardia sp. alder85J]|uniref:FHA domain-containing protein n=1 Tax=Nocardia sp. alder85J TaxID=2862949 RepID=UPI001CD6F1F4|nr:FHA domain-containing protein [Nocardia sp. alder85J]MCX4096231.1 FHA domain-containing protein [Nocardia sp. alder85J]